MRVYTCLQETRRRWKGSSVYDGIAEKSLLPPPSPSRASGTHRTIGGLNEIGNCLNPSDINAAHFSDPFFAYTTSTPQDARPVPRGYTTAYYRFAALQYIFYLIHRYDLRRQYAWIKIFCNFSRYTLNGRL